MANERQIEQEKVRAMMTAMQREAVYGSSSRIAEAALKPALVSAHHYDAGPTTFVPFQPLVPSGAMITGTVGGADVDLYATVSATSEAGFISIDRHNGNQWVMTGGNGGSCGWGVVLLEWALAQPGPAFKPDYTAVSGGDQSYVPIDDFANDVRLFHYKPLHGRTINASGGGITAHLRLRPLGPASAIVPFLGASLSGIGPDACQMIQKMVLEESENFGPIWTKKLFKPAGGRKQLLNNVFGGGQIKRIQNVVRGLFGRTDAPREIPE